MFAKILNSEKLGQILVTKEYNSEEDISVVVITFEFQEMLIKSSIGCSTEKQVVLFDETNLEKAEAIIKDILPEIMRDTIFNS